MNHKNPLTSSAAILYSASLNARNDLRDKLNDAGLNAVCFENEAVCFDNFKSILPKIVVVETDSRELAWRFVFAMHTSRLQAALLIVTENSMEPLLESYGTGLHVTCTSLKGISHGLFKKLLDMTDNYGGQGEHLNGSHLPIFVGQSAEILKIKAMLPNIIESRDSVLIVGEPGSGKEYLSRLIVAMSSNEDMFIKIDCRELMPELLVNGWFSATFENGNRNKPSTIFLDHIDQMSTESQAEMRLLIESSRRSLKKMGSNNRNTIRFVATSDMRIEPLVDEGAFRKDLFYRLNVIPVDIPPLRKRRGDISLLMDYFVIDACNKLNKCISVPSQKAREMLYMHSWPGNIKELKDQMWRVAESGNESCLFANTRMPKVKKNSGQYLLNVLGREELPKSSEIINYLRALQDMSLKGICNEFVTRTEKRLMKRALESTNWNRRKAAQLLNISYKSMLNKIKSYGI